MAKNNNTAVEPKKNNAVAAAHDYSDYGMTGYENTSKDDFSIPFIKVLQSMSPEVKPVNKGGLEGAAVGKILNSVTQELIEGEKGIEFVPATTETVYIEWKPREAGGGFVAIHKLDSDVVADAIKKNNNSEFGQLKTPAGNDLIKTFNLYVVLTDGTAALGYAIISATSTKIKVCRQLMAKLRSFMLDIGNGRKVNPPLFANRVKMHTVEQKNAKGEFYNIHFTSAEKDVAASLLPKGHPVLEEAVKFAKMVNEGKAKADFSKESTASTGAASEDATGDEEVPF